MIERKQLRGLGDFRMSNLTLINERNGTFSLCDTIYSVHDVMNSILLFFSFPATFVVLVILMYRFYNAGRFSSAEIFLLQFNLTNVCLFAFNLLLFLDVIHVHHLSPSIVYDIFFSATLTARPLFLLAICVIFYLAIAHPVTYVTIKTYRHWEWLVIALGWLYASAINAVIIVYNFDIAMSIYAVLLYSVILPSMFFNIATLRALVSSGPDQNGQTLNPAKRKAFRITQSILLILLLYYIPRMYIIIYLYIVPEDYARFICAEGTVLSSLPKVSEIAMPVVFLYSLRKLGV